MSASGDELVKLSQLKELISQQSIPPVGAVYTSYTSTSPASIWGGSWTELKGVFPYFNHGTTASGSNSHTHTLNSGFTKLNSSGSQIFYESKGGVAQWATNWFVGDTFHTSYGSTSGMNTNGTGLGGTTDTSLNMPAYQTLYAWRRTA